jgi:hypothetical protein
LTGGLKDQDPGKKIDMKEGYRPAAAKKERMAKRGGGNPEAPTAGGAVLT